MVGAPTRLFLCSKMVFAYIRTATFVLVAVVFISWFMGAEGTYRKPPFNGSIFGKRGVTAG